MGEETALVESGGQNVSERLLSPTQEEIKNTLSELAEVYANHSAQDRQTKSGNAAVVFARQYGVLPSTGINASPSVEKGEIAFSNGSFENSETAVTTPFGSSSCAVDVDIVAAHGGNPESDRPAIINIALMREDSKSNIALRLVKSDVSADVNKGTLTDPHTNHIEIYQSGQKTHQILVDSKGICLSAFEYQLDPEELAKRISGASIIPTKVKEMNLTDHKLGPAKDDHLELKELQGRTIDLTRLDNLVRTVDAQGSILNTDLKQGINEVLGQNIF